MKKLYLDAAAAGCTAVFVKDAEVIPAGTTVHAMSARHRNSEYQRFAEEYGIRFLFEDQVPAIGFCTVPRVDIFATDGEGGLFGSVGQTTDLEADIPICHIDADRHCSLVAESGKAFLASAARWRELLTPYDGITFFDSLEAARAQLPFIDCMPRQPELTYRLPCLGDEAILRDYVREHHEFGEPTVSASVGLQASDFAHWVEKIRQNAEVGNENWGKSLLYLCFAGDRLVGLLSIRYSLPQALSETLGDIGYGVRPGERNKGYATAMLAHALSVCKAKGKTRLILGCYKDNIASARTILKNGGVLLWESDAYCEGRVSQYYSIDV